MDAFEVFTNKLLLLLWGVETPAKDDLERIIILAEKIRYNAAARRIFHNEPDKKRIHSIFTYVFRNSSSSAEQHKRKRFRKLDAPSACFLAARIKVRDIQHSDKEVLNVICDKTPTIKATSEFPRDPQLEEVYNTRNQGAVTSESRSSTAEPELTTHHAIPSNPSKNLTGLRCFCGKTLICYSCDGSPMRAAAQ